MSFWKNFNVITNLGCITTVSAGFTCLNSQAPDVPELAHQGIFHLSRLSVNCYVKTVKKWSLYLSLTDFLKLLSEPQDQCGSHNNFMKFLPKNYTLYHKDFMVFTYFQILAFVSIVSRLTTQKHIFICQKLFKVKKNYFLGSNFINLSEKLVK